MWNQQTAWNQLTLTEMEEEKGWNDGHFQRTLFSFPHRRVTAAAIAPQCFCQCCCRKGRQRSVPPLVPEKGWMMLIYSLAC